MVIKNSLEHAHHNYRACNFISQKSEYSDWCITIAFYAAIHYIRYLMLPCIDLGTTYNTFESLFRVKKIQGEGRHGYQLRYVKDHYPEIDYEYAKLHDMSNNARYIDYKYGRDEAKQAKRYLNKIKDFAEKK
jgi:hypothetical protein